MNFLQKYTSSLLTLLLITALSVQAQTDSIELQESDDGWRLLVNEESFMVHGMNWDYFPIGTNYMYDF